MYICTINYYGMGIYALNVSANTLDCLQQNINVSDVWQVLNTNRFFGQNRCCQNTQCRILCSTYYYFAGQRCAAFDYILIHFYTSVIFQY